MDVENASITDKRVIINGAGLSGALLACLLCQSGLNVILIEKRKDPRKHGFDEGRSINLALAERGFHALCLAGLTNDVIKRSVPMYGRMIHSVETDPALHHYGLNKEKIWSVNRADLACCLLDATERAGAVIKFESHIREVKFTAKTLSLVSGEQLSYDLLVGADGADSSVRKQLSSVIDLGLHSIPLEHGYKELKIPPGHNHGAFQLYPNALHIWPRGGFMCIALPNIDGSFTTTLFLPHKTSDPERPFAFSELSNGTKARAFFNSHFGDLSNLVTNLETDFENNPIGKLKTLRVECWQAFDSVVLIGDAAHPMVPFHGQGMNCALEDAVTLFESLTSYPRDLGRSLSDYEHKRKPNASAIQDMALENYREMRHSVCTQSYMLERDLSNWIAQHYPERFVPRYSLVTFSRVPYEIAYKRGQIQSQLLQRLTKDCLQFSDIDLEAVKMAVHSELSDAPREFNN